MSESSHQQREIEELLTNQAMSDEKSAAIVDALISDALSARASVEPVTEPEVVDDVDDSDKVFLPQPPAADDDRDETDDELVDEPVRPVWLDDKPEPVHVADDMQSVEPRLDDTDRAQQPPEQAQPAKEPRRVVQQAADNLLVRGKALSRRTKVTITTAAVMIVCASTIIMASQHHSPQSYVVAPPASPVADPPQASHPQETVLQPGCPQGDTSCHAITQHGCANTNSDAAAAFDMHQINGRYTNAWICMLRWPGVVGGQMMTLQFPQPVVVTQICVIPGYAYVEPNGSDHWGEHLLVTLISWKLGNQEWMQQIDPSAGGACRTFPNVGTQLISATVEAVVRPPRPAEHGLLAPDFSEIDKSFAVGHVTVTGYEAGAGA